MTSIRRLLLYEEKLKNARSRKPRSSAVLVPESGLRSGHSGTISYRYPANRYAIAIADRDGRTSFW